MSQAQCAQDLHRDYGCGEFEGRSIEALIERLRRMLVAMTANSGQQS